ncbi:MAG: phenylacetic acid degradation bifunctional protein PaaZ [Methylacidiphilales bacterium]|nr:phenylacetic acid degradation bifunctional protein PaaZ [Candidatus Methylacidiphilales bacterium]
MIEIKSFVNDKFISGTKSQELIDANSSVPVASFAHISDSEVQNCISYAKSVGNPTLRALTIHQRALLLKQLGLALLEQKETLYKVSTYTGATRADSWVDIEGGIGTMLSISSIARRELPDQPFITEGNLETLSKSGSFVARHILTPKTGVAVHINAFNFPIWGMLEKFAPTFIAGVPSIIKPATQTSYLTFALMKLIQEVNCLPKGSLSLLIGNIHSLLDHLDGQDTVTFTGSASTAKTIASNQNLIHHNVKINKEADSLNAIVFGESARPGTVAFSLGVKEVLRELTAKAGQKCTAIRRVIIHEDFVKPFQTELEQQLQRVQIAPAGYQVEKGKVHLGPLVSLTQRREVQEQVALLRQSADILIQSPITVIEGSEDKGGFMAPVVLIAKNPEASELHSIEAFGPVCTVIPYQNISQAIALTNKGEGSLVASIVSTQPEEQQQLTLGIAPYHGRLLLINELTAKESTGHGSPLAPLVHGGPGRAGGGEELGGVRSIKYYMQRTALQGTPTDLTSVTQEYYQGAITHEDIKHPFRKYFNELHIGDSLTTHKRTVTEADIVNFGCLTGDHFYAHFDETATASSLFGKRVAHGYYLVSMAAGLFVWPNLGPVLANYGMDNLRFIEPVGIGDTIQATITVKRKIEKPKKEGDNKKTGVVVWYVQLFNQHSVLVAMYDILTLVQINENI